jgi:hypothetical protein
MSNDYLWDRSGIPDLDIKWLEELLAPLAHDAPLDEVRLAKGRRGGQPVRATAQEPVEAPPASGRAKGKMNFFDKRIIGTATLTAAICIFGVTLYEHHDRAPHRQSEYVAAPDARIAVSTHPFPWTPPSPPVSPTTGADLAISAGESARIHVPFGAVDVEIKSKCNAEVEMSVVTGSGLKPGAHPGDLPTVVAGPPSESHSLGGDPVIAGTDSPDGRTHTYHLVPVFPSGMVQYTAQCLGQPLMHGVLDIDRDDANEPIGPITNARVFSDADMGAEHAIHVLGTVLPGASVSISGKPVTLQPPEPGSYDDLPIAPTFSADVPISAEHPVVAVRVDDAMGTHFYVSRRSISMIPSCETDQAGVRTMAEAKQTAAKLDAQRDHAAALRTLKAAITRCTPDRDTLSLALEYACKAGDVDAARTFWRKVPQELQRTLEPVCVRSDISRHQLENP